MKRKAPKTYDLLYLESPGRWRNAGVSMGSSAKAALRSFKASPTGWRFFKHKLKTKLRRGNAGAGAGGWVKATAVKIVRDGRGRATNVLIRKPAKKRAARKKRTAKRRR